MKTTMRAVVLDGGVAVRRDYPVPVPEQDEVLVRVTRAGICDTDLQLMAGYMGFRGVPGHEFVGVAQGGKYKGKRVTAEINCGCGKCELCVGGMANHCPNRTVVGILGRDGAFADYVRVQERNVHALPDELGDDEAVFVEPLAAAFQVPRQVPLERRHKVLVLGDGKLGNLVAQVVKLYGCQVMVVGKHERKLQLVERLGIPAERLDEFRRRRAHDIVVDCTGREGGLAAAMEFVRPRGTIVLKTTVAGPHSVNLAPIVVDEVTVVGSRCGPFGTAIDALRSKKVQVLPLVDEIYRLEDAAGALEAAREPERLKVLLAVDETVPAVKRLREGRG